MKFEYDYLGLGNRTFGRASPPRRQRSAHFFVGSTHSGTIYPGNRHAFAAGFTVGNEHTAFLLAPGCVDLVEHAVPAARGSD